MGTYQGRKGERSKDKWGKRKERRCRSPEQHEGKNIERVRERKIFGKGRRERESAGVEDVWEVRGNGIGGNFGREGERRVEVGEWNFGKIREWGKWWDQDVGFGVRG